MKTTEPSLLVIDDLRLVIYFEACQTMPTILCYLAINEMLHKFTD